MDPRAEGGSIYAHAQGGTGGPRFATLNRGGIAIRFPYREGSTDRTVGVEREGSVFKLTAEKKGRVLFRR